MTEFDGPDEKDAHSKLAQGLKSCRSVVKNYRSLLEKDWNLEQLSVDPPGAQESSPGE